jgi:hypothetical protein
MGIIDGGSVTVQETFLSFVHTTVSTAEGLAELVSKWLVEHGLEAYLCKFRSQGYDGASVMSGKIGGYKNACWTLSQLLAELQYALPLSIVHHTILTW